MHLKKDAQLERLPTVAHKITTRLHA